MCNDGFEGDGYQCAPEEISCAKEDICHEFATCKYDEKLGKSVCVCNKGRVGDGFNCSSQSNCFIHNYNNFKDMKELFFLKIL